MTMSALGIAPKVLASTVVGSAVGMVLGEGKWWHRLVRAAGGFSIAILTYPIGARLMGAALGSVVPEKWMPPLSDLDVLSGLVIAVTGMIACQAALNAVTAVRDNVDEFVGEHMAGDEK